MNISSLEGNNFLYVDQWKMYICWLNILVSKIIIQEYFKKYEYNYVVVYDFGNEGAQLVKNATLYKKVTFSKINKDKKMKQI